MNQHDPTDAGVSRLIFLADALKLVPFSETTDSRGERRAGARIQRAPALCREHLPWPQVGQWKGGAR